MFCSRSRPCGLEHAAAYGITSRFRSFKFDSLRLKCLTEICARNVATFLGFPYHLSTPLSAVNMNDDPEIDWGNDEDDPMLTRAYLGSVEMGYVIGGDEADDVEDAVSLGGDEDDELAAYGARPDEQDTFSADRVQAISSRRGARRPSASVSVSPRKDTSQAQPAPLPPSPQSEFRQPTPKLTHALPPKPVASSIRAPPSTTAASPMSLPRKERRSNGNATKKGEEPLPLEKETRSSRTAGRDGRQRDTRDEESSWTRPSPGATDSQPLTRDRARSFDDRDERASLWREDDCYRPSHHRAHYSSDEEGRGPNPHRTQSRHDARYRYDDRDHHHDYASGDRRDRPVAKSARLAPEDDSLDRSRTGYRESNDSDYRRAHPRVDDSPDRDDNSRRILRRDDYSPYDSYGKGSRDYDYPPRRNSGAAERSRYPESFNGRTSSVVARDSHTLNQGPGRSSTLSTLSASCRPMPNAPYAFLPSRSGGPIFLFPEKPWQLSTTWISASTDSQVFIVAFSLFVSMLYAMSRSQQLFPPHVSSYRTQFSFTPPAITLTPLQSS
jgi:hypothetical protein